MDDPHCGDGDGGLAQSLVTPSLLEGIRDLPLVFYQQSPLVMGLCEAQEDDMLNLDCNHKAAQFFRRSPDEVRGRTSSSMGAPRHCIHDWLACYRKSVELGHPSSFEYQTPCDNEIKWMMCTIYPFKLAPPNDMRPTFCYIVNDVTAIRRAREEKDLALNELRKQREKYETLVSTIPAIVWEADPESKRFTFVSPQAESKLGYPLSDWLQPGFLGLHMAQEPSTSSNNLNSNISTIGSGDVNSHTHSQQPNGSDKKRSNEALSITQWPGASPEELQSHALAVSNENLRLERDMWLRGADGRLRLLRNRISQLRLSGSESGRVVLRGLMWDVTEQHQLAEARQAQQTALAASKMKSQFLATMSHEIRTPLNALVGLAELFLDALDDPRQRDAAQSILYKRLELNSSKIFFSHLLSSDCSTSLQRLLTDIVDLERVEAGRLHIEHVSFDLRALLEDLIGLFCARPRSVSLVLDFPVFIPQKLVGDPARLRQVLTNLISNALKFTPADGRITVRVETARPEDLPPAHSPTMVVEADGSPIQGVPSHQPSVTLKFSVRDTGIGISHDKATQLFNLYDQLDPSMYRKYGGSGMGLYISKLLVSLMGGTINVRSEPQKGSEFWFTLPLQLGAPLSECTPLSTVTLDKPTTVLLVDRHSDQSAFLSAQLQSWGFSVLQLDRAAPVLHTLSMASTTPPIRLVLLDDSISLVNSSTNNSPSIASSSLVNEIHTLQPQLAIIVVTRTLSKTRLESSPLIGTLTRPVRLSTLHSLIYQLLLKQPCATVTGSATSDNRKKRSGGDIGILDNGAAPKKLLLTREQADSSSSTTDVLSNVENDPQIHNLKARIMIVDDNRVNQDITARLLLRCCPNLVLDIASDGEEAVRMFQRRHAQHQPYDLVLIDAHMPVMDGFESTKRMRELEKEQSPSKRTPILALTADVMDGVAERCVVAGMDAHIAKPLRIADIPALLRKHLLKATPPSETN